jgi:UDP-3-O-[3-hydroxymyristoyl] glucosamine N-acyltransferase
MQGSGAAGNKGLGGMIASNVSLDAGVVVHHPDLVNLYGCSIGPGTRIGTFVEIQKNAVIGSHCKISSTGDAVHEIFYKEEFYDCDSSSNKKF